MKALDQFDIKGRSAIVTGAASGIGLCYAEAMAEAGAGVTLTDIDLEGAEREAKRLRDEGYDARAARMAVLAAKARAGDAAVSICRRAVHLHGAMGFTDECDIGLYLKRAISLNATLGQPEDLRLEFVNLERAA